MANSNTKTVRFSAKTFASGVAKSTGSAVKAVLSDYAPFMTGTIENTVESANDAATFIKENNPLRRNKNKDPLLRKIINSTSTVLSGVKSDFFTGDLNFTGTTKIISDFASKYTGDDDWGFDDNPFEDLDDSANDSSPFNNFDAKTYADGVYATATAVTQSAKISANAIIANNYKALDAASNKMIASNLANYTKMNMQMSMTNSSLNTINNNIISLVEFNNTTMNNYVRTMTEHVAKQQSFMENMTELITQMSNTMRGVKGKNKYAVNPDEYDFLEGGFDPKKFVRNIRHNADENTMLGQYVFAGISGIMKAIFGKSPKLIEGEFGNGIGFDIKDIKPFNMLIPFLFPSLEKLKGVDKSAKNLSKIFFAKAYEGKLGGGDLLKDLLKTFGYKPEHFPTGLSDYEKGATPWNGKDSMALQTVIPSYLSDIDNTLKNMEDSVIDAIRSVTDTITLYGEMYRTGDKQINHSVPEGSSRYTTRRFVGSDGKEYSTVAADYSNNYKTNRRNVQKFFDYDDGIFTNAESIIEKGQKDFAMMVQDTFNEALENIGKAIKDSTLSESDMKKVKNGLTDIIYDFDPWGDTETLSASQIQLVTKLLKDANPNITKDQLNKIIVSLNTGRLNANANWSKYTKRHSTDSTMRLFADKIYYGNDDAKSSMIQDAKDKERIQFKSYEDVIIDGLYGGTPEERARRRQERERLERERRERERSKSFKAKVMDFLGLDRANAVVENTINKASSRLDDIAVNMGDDVPTFKTGAFNIDADKIVKVHKGEMILPPDTSEAVRKHVEDFISGKVNDLDDEIVGKRYAEQIRRLLKKKNIKQVSGVVVATQEMWESEEIQKSTNPFEFLLYKIDEIGENLKIIGNNAIERLKKESSDNASSDTKHKLFGDEDENGYRTGGLLSKATNRVLSAKNKALHSLFGKGYTDLDTGENVEEDKKNSFFGKYKEWLSKSVDNITGSLGLSTDNKKRIKAAADFLGENTDKLIIGGAAGMIANAMFGISFGPLVGIASSIALSQDSIKAKLFGSKNSDGSKNDDGLIKQQTQEFVKNNLFKLVTGGIAGMLGMGAIRKGVIGSVVTGAVGSLAGLISSLPGGGIVGTALNAATGLAMGPLAGALIGVGATALSQTDAVKNVLFGEEKEVNGKKVRDGGLLGGLKKSLGKVTDAVSTAILGDKVRMTDQDGNETTRRRGGILEKLKNAVNVHLIGPITDAGTEIKDHFTMWFKFEVLGSLKNIISPITARLEDMADGFAQGGKSIASTIVNTITKAFSPVTKAVTSVADAMVEMTLGSIKGAVKLSLGIASTPLKMLASVMNIGNARTKMKIEKDAFMHDLGIFKDEFSQFKDGVAKIWLGDNYKGKIHTNLDVIKGNISQSISEKKNQIENSPAYIAITNGIEKIREDLATKYENDIKPKLDYLTQKVKPVLDKAGEIGSKLFGKIFSGIGDRLKHPASTFSKDYKSGYDSVNNFGRKLSDKFHNSKIGRTVDMFGVFQNSRKILTGNLGIGIRASDVTDRNIENEDWYQSYMSDRSAYIDTKMFEDGLSELERTGIHSVEDAKKYRMYKNHLNAANKIQNKTAKLQKKLSRKYGYADDDFERLSEDEKNDIRKQIAKVTGKDTSNWTTKDLANFAHRSKAEVDQQKNEQTAAKEKEAKQSRTQDVILALPDTLTAQQNEFVTNLSELMTQQQTSASEFFKSSYDRIVESINNIKDIILTGLGQNAQQVDQTNNLLETTIETSRDNTRTTTEYIDATFEEIRNDNNKAREDKTRADAKKARDAKESLETRHSQALGSQNIDPNDVSGTRDDVSQDNQGIFDDDNYVDPNDGNKKQGILSKLVGGVGKFLGGASALVKGGLSLIGKSAIPIAAIAGVSLLWPVIKKLPWDKIVGAIPKLISGAASALVKGVGTLVTDVLPTVVSEVTKNIPDMISGLTTGIVDGIKVQMEERKEEKQVANTYVNADGEIVESNIMDASDKAIRKVAQTAVTEKITRSAAKSVSNNIIGEANTTKIVSIGNKIKEALQTTFRGSIGKHAANKVGKSKLVGKVASKTGTKMDDIKDLTAYGVDKAFKKFDDVIRYITKDNTIARKFTSIMDKLAVKLGGKGISSMDDLISSCSVHIKIIATAWDACWGAANVERYFHIPHEKFLQVFRDSDALMRAIAAGFNVAENFIPVFGLIISIFFDAVAELAVTDTSLASSIGYDGDLRCRICSDLYIKLSNDANKEYDLKCSQIKFLNETKDFNEKFGTNINTTQMARAQNPFLSERIFDSKSLISSDWRNQDDVDVSAYIDDTSTSQSTTTTSTSNGESSSGGFGNGDESIGYGGHFTQTDPRWSKLGYGKFRNGRRSTLGAGGCGPTSLANAINNVTGAVVTNPARIAKFAAKNGYTADGGTSAALFNNANRLGVTTKSLSTSANSITSQLKSGHNVIVSGRGGSAYTSAGHIMTVKGIDSRGNAVVDDPLARNSRRIPMNKLTRGMTHAWSIGKRSGSVGYGVLDDGSGDNYAEIRDFMQVGKSDKNYFTADVPTFDRANASITNWNSLYPGEPGKRIVGEPIDTLGLLFGYNDKNSSGCFLNTLVSAVITMIRRFGSVTKKFDEIVKEITPSKMKSEGIGVSPDDNINNYTALIDNITKHLNDTSAITATEYSGMNDEVRVQMVADALDKSVPIILHTNKAFDDKDWPTWASAIFGNNKNGNVRDQHAIMIPNIVQNSGSDGLGKDKYALIADPGSSLLSNGSDPSGKQMRLVPVEYLLGGINKYKLNHVLAFGNNKTSRNSNSGTGTVYDAFKNRYTDNKAVEMAENNKQLSLDSEVPIADAVYSTSAGEEYVNGDVQSSASSSSDSLGFFDVISTLTEKFSQIGGAILDSLFTGNDFVNPFANDPAYDFGNGGSGNDDSLKMRGSGSVDASTIVSIANSKGFAASAQDIGQLISLAYSYAVQNGLSFISTNDDATAMVVCANALLTSSTFKKYRTSYVNAESHGSYVTFCNLRYDEFVYKCLIVARAYKDAIVRMPDTKTVSTFMDSLVDKIVKDNPYIPVIAGTTYSGTDLSRYQTWAVNNSGFISGYSANDTTTPYVSTKLPATTQQDMLNYIRRMITMSETGYDPDVANPNDNEIYFNPVALSGEKGITLGRAGFYNTNAAEVIARLYNAPLSNADKITAKNLANRIANGERSDAFINEVRNFIRKPSIAPYVKHIQNAMSTQFVSGYFNKPFKYYDQDIIKDPRSILMGAEFGGIGPKHIPDFYQYLPSSSNNELDNVRNGMLATAKTFDNWSTYSKGWTNRINRDYNTMLNGGNYPLPQSVIDAIPSDAPKYTGSVGYGLADEMRESTHRIPTSEIYTSDDNYNRNGRPVDVNVDQTPVTNRLDRIIAWLDKLSRTNPEKATQVTSVGFGEINAEGVSRTSNDKLSLNKKDHVPNGTAVDKLRLIHNAVARRTRV